MKLILDEEQAALLKTARQFMDERSPVSRVRELRDSADATGFSRALWKRMAELGWVGLNLPEAYGGSELGLFELCLILEAGGRNLCPEPFLSTVVLGAGALMAAGTDAQKAAWLPRVAEGDAIVALASDEANSRYDVCAIEARAELDGDGYRLSGEKSQVLDGHVADLLIVSARTAGGRSDREGVTLFLVEAGTPGLSVTRQSRVDGRNAAIVTLESVEVGPGALLGAPGAGCALLETLRQRAAAAVSAEMLGLASAAYEQTLAYLKERVQFGVPIGSFQALQHRAARLFIELELARSSVLAAARAADDDPAAFPELAALAKARASELVIHVTNEAVQMHGGIGMTDELDLGFYMKRARATAVAFGDASFWRTRWADLRGY
ncbi:MAG: acyl-CoA dehydrogenase family protein [Deltaproteobacteria bacterium]|nr:acyl-CoA dehydrogenase family protein [Deltaproteobacteria bacterium]